MSWLRRLLNVLRPGRMHGRIAREVSFHLAERTDALVAEGLTADEAARRARRQFGNVPLQAERTRDVDVALWLDAALRNLRLAVRALGRAPGFTATVVVILALGIGANTAVFSAIDAVLLQPLPYSDPDRLVRVSQVSEIAGDTSVAGVRLGDWQRLSSTFAAVSGHVIEDISDTTGDSPQRVRRATVMPRFLEAWGVSPAVGRGFTDAEHRLGGPAAVLISERYWRTRFAADPAVLDRSLWIVDRSRAIVGVLPDSFAFPDPDVDWWVPEWVDAPWTQNRTFNYFAAIGRLAPGVTLEQAREDLRRVQSRLAEQHPETDRGIEPRLVPMRDSIVGGVRGSLWLVFGAVSVLLLIACTNIAALLLSRAVRRRDEATIRLSLGASRASVAAQTLTEAAVLAAAGAAAGLLVAMGAAAALRSLAPDLPRIDEVAIDLRILAYTAASGIVVTLLCGLAPAVRSAPGDASLTRVSHSRVSPGHSLQWLLVGAQVALSVILLAGAGLLLRSFDKLSRVEAGFDPTHVLTFRVTGSFGEDTDYDRTVQRINSAIDGLAALPGVHAAATTTGLPGTGGRFSLGYQLAEEGENARRMNAEARVVSPEYFETMQIPLLDGELCGRPRGAEGTTQVMVNRRFADRYFPDRSPVGLHLAATTPDRIMGVVGDARELGIDDEPVPTVYSCFSAPSPIPWYLVRTSGDPIAHAADIRRTINELEPLRSVYDIVSLETRIGHTQAQTRLRTILLTLFAATALGLVCAGVYGTLSYAVGLRRREVALRLALGAARGRVVRQLMDTSVRVVIAGCLAGLVLALLFARMLQTMLYGVSPNDPATLAGVVALVGTVAALASLLPALRATLVQPMNALRDE